MASTQKKSSPLRRREKLSELIDECGRARTRSSGRTQVSRRALISTEKLESTTGRSGRVFIRYCHGDAEKAGGEVENA